MSGQHSAGARHARGNSLGHAPNTIKGDGAAIKFYEAYRRIRNKSTLEDMLFIEIESDNLESEIISICAFASSTPIPRYYVNDFEPPPRRPDQEDEPIQIIIPNTLSKYIGKILKILQYKFPHHPEFESLDINKPSDVPEFWTSLGPQFKKACNTYQNSIGSDYTFGDTTKRPLYSSNNLTQVNEDESIRDYVSMIDLEYMLKKLVKGATTMAYDKDGALQHRFMLQ